MNVIISIIRRAKARIASRLSSKLILLFSSIIILVVGSLTFISYKMLQRESVQHNIASTAKILALVNRNMEEYMAGIEQFSLSQMNYDETIYAVLNESKDYASRMFLEDYLKALFYSRKDVETIYLYIIEQDKYYTVSKEGYDARVRVGEHPQITGLPWYTRAMESLKNQEFQTFVTDAEMMTGYPINTEKSVMAYHRVMRSIVTRKPQALVSFYFNASGRDHILDDIPVGEGEHLLLMDPENRLFYADQLATMEKLAQDPILQQLLAQQAGQQAGQQIWSDDGNKYLVSYNVGDRAGWKLVKPISYQKMYEAANATRGLNVLIGLAFLVLAIVLVLILSNAITRPIKKLTIHMDRFSTGHFDAVMPVHGNDEIAHVSRHFNQMVRRTDELINERYKMKLVEKNAILKALEAEINPHFLYNALQAISTKALRYERFDIADMIDALALTLRYCINGKDIVYAHEELKHIERYMGIQEARFGNRLHVVYAWEPELMALKIPKLSIQTLVENAIKHGLEKTASPVTITIQAYALDHHAVIAVQDDGPGFAPERLQQVLHSLEQAWDGRVADSKGLVNLHTRLQLLYGEDMTFEICTGEQGTVMKIQLPWGEDNDA